VLLSGDGRRARLQEATLLLIFTPDLAGEGALGALERALPHVDVIQVRPKVLGDRAPGAPKGATITSARDALYWCRKVLALRAASDLATPPLVLVNDRVDVAAALAPEGLDGVHVGASDTPPAIARQVLAADQVIGLSTHGAADLAAALDEPVDMLGFGPVFPTSTKGYVATPDSGTQPTIVGPERAWLAAESSAAPVFPIGGIDLSNADQLDRVGRAAVGSAILGAEDPALAARALRTLLETGDE
jgi:thiamine-phosphate pyrophosphorylase